MSTKYPSPEDDNFNQFVKKKYSQFTIPKKKKSMEEICFPKKFEHQIPQIFLSKFINPQTPYRGLLVYHRIGAGKTCAAIQITEGCKKDMKILVVLPASLIGNFRGELRSLCVGNTYLLKNERDVLKKMSPSDPEYGNVFKKIISDSDKRINKFYNIMSYNKFISLAEEKNINLDNTLLVIDEVHNMVSESGRYYDVLTKLLKRSPKTYKIVIMTATPMFDKPMELALTMNLLPMKKKIPTGTSFINKFMTITETKNGLKYNVKNMNSLKEMLNGYISYYRGAPSYTFPEMRMNIQKCKMSDHQYKLYLKVDKIDNATSPNKIDYVNEEISNSFFIGTRMISNIAYPNGALNEDGYESMEDTDFEMKNIKIYSPKIHRIVRKAKKCEGTCFIYSNFKEYGGLAPLVKTLEQNGFKNYEFHGSGKKRFALWSGDQDMTYKEQVKSLFNRKENINGEYIKIILGSPSIKEGVSLLRVREVHIMEPYWNMSRLDQVIGRANRYCSHKDMPKDLRHVDVYIYMATHPEIKETVDQKIMEMAIEKQKIVGEFEKAIKESAIDCQLFYNANNDGSNYKCAV